MDAYPTTPSCNLAWIDAVVNTIATSAPSTLPPKLTNPNDLPLDVTKFSQCCTAPGQCRAFGKEEDMDSCNSFGALTCQLGNSRYICTFIQFPKKTEPSSTPGAPAPVPTSSPPSPPTISPLPGANMTDPPLLPDEGFIPEPLEPSPGPEPTVCLQEGTLAITRGLPCCPSNVSKFLASGTATSPRTCLAKDGSDYLRDFCCQPGDTGLCGTTENADPNFVCGGGEGPDYMYETLNYGNKYAIYEGYTFGAVIGGNGTEGGVAPLELACVEEVEFGVIVNQTSACAKIEKTNCNLGGSTAGKAPAAPGPWIDGSGGNGTNGGSGSGGAKSSARRGKGVAKKVAAVLLVGPLLVQMLFL